MIDVSENRLVMLRVWVDQALGQPIDELNALAADASFRRYFRVGSRGERFVVMDAPPEHEDCRPFVAVANTLVKHGFCAPEVIAENLECGFLLLSDLGDEVYMKHLTADSVDNLYQRAWKEIIKFGDLKTVENYQLPQFDEAFVVREFNLFREWYVQQYLSAVEDEKLLKVTLDHIIENTVSQPNVFVHRDFHADNLLLVDGRVGILDFQDAVWGPITYDLVHLIRDCRISWPEKQVAQWLKMFFNELSPACNFEQFVRWFDFMSLQIHLKVLGVFARLNIRDGKIGYEKHFDRIKKYVIEVSAKYPELENFNRWFSVL